MRIRLSLIITTLFLFCLSILSCKKETSCEGCKEDNKLPIAIAGPDKSITLPLDSILLDGSASNDPDGTISQWQWTKIGGPIVSNLRSPNATQTIATSLIQGVYEFELKVLITPACQI